MLKSLIDALRCFLDFLAAYSPSYKQILGYCQLGKSLPILLKRTSEFENSLDVEYEINGKESSFFDA